MEALALGQKLQMVRKGTDSIWSPITEQDIYDGVFPTVR